MLKPFECFLAYMVIKGCFINKKLSIGSRWSFEDRYDKKYYYTLSDRFSNINDISDMFVSHFIQFNGIDKYIKEIVNDTSVYTNWRRRNKSLSYMFDNEVSTLSKRTPNFESLFEVSKNDICSLPLIINKFISGIISIETLTILDMCANYRLSKISLDINNNSPRKEKWRYIQKILPTYQNLININIENFIPIIQKSYKEI